MKQLSQRNSLRTAAGYTLVEIMIVIAILAIVAAIAIPSYTGYVSASRDAAATANLEPLRLALEDFWLDNGTYVAGTYNDGSSVYTLRTNLGGWQPDGDEARADYIYTVGPGASGIATSFVITVSHVLGGGATFTK